MHLKSYEHTAIPSTSRTLKHMQSPETPGYYLLEVPSITLQRTFSIPQVPVHRTTSSVLEKRVSYKRQAVTQKEKMESRLIVLNPLDTLLVVCMQLLPGLIYHTTRNITYPPAPIQHSQTQPPPKLHSIIPSSIQPLPNTAYIPYPTKQLLGYVPPQQQLHHTTTFIPSSKPHH